MLNSKMLRLGLGSVVIAAMALVTTAGYSAERTVKLAGWGAKSGPLRSFGVNSHAVLKSVIKVVNDAGGVKMGDGVMAKIEDRTSAV